MPSKYPGKRHFKGPNKGKLSGNPKGKNPTDVWEFPNVKNNHPEKTAHPCQFPVELVERLVLSMTDLGDLVLDPYMGVGSSVIAAMKHGRVGYGCDIVEEYVEIARERIETIAGRPPAYSSYGQANLRSRQASGRPLMQIAAQYSHLNGHEYLLVHHPELWEEMQAVRSALLRERPAERDSSGARRSGGADMNRAFRAEFPEVGANVGKISG